MRKKSQRKISHTGLSSTNRSFAKPICPLRRKGLLPERKQAFGLVEGLINEEPPNKESQSSKEEVCCLAASRCRLTGQMNQGHWQSG